MVRRFSWLVVASISLAVLGCGSSEDAHHGGDSKAGGGGDAGSAGSPAGGGSAGSALSGGSSGSAGTNGTAPTVDEFCQLWSDEFAAYMQRCACDSAAVMRYREWFATQCEPTGFLGSLPAAVAAGELTFDGHAALSLFERLHEPEPECLGEPFRALKLDSVEVYSLAGVFLGTRALGEPCVHPVSYKGGVSDCREGVCAWDGADAGVCIELVGLGDECDASGEDFRSTAPRVCHEQRPPDDDGEYASAFDSLICDASTGDPGSRHCLNDRPGGSACRSNDVCRSGPCLRSNGTNDGVCTAKVANGEPCQSHLECASGACQSSEPRVCGALLADGEACGYQDSACQSGSCTNHANAICVPPATLAPGESCTASSECMSRGHGDSRDAACQAGRCVADICAEYAE
jgi:hypothetical protein